MQNDDRGRRCGRDFSSTRAGLRWRRGIVAALLACGPPQQVEIGAGLLEVRRIDHGIDDRAGGVAVRALHQAQQLLLAVRYAGGALSDVRTFEKVVFAGLYPEAAGLLRD